FRNGHLLLSFMKYNARRKIQRLDAEYHRLNQHRRASENRQLQDWVLFGQGRKPLALGHYLPVGTTHRDSIRMRGAHHHSFNDRLPADYDLVFSHNNTLYRAKKKLVAGSASTLRVQLAHCSSERSASCCDRAARQPMLDC